MKTEIEKRYWSRIRLDGRDHDRGQEWVAGRATAGAAVWAGIAALARTGTVRVGAIELLFLFGPLVIVPLGVELGRRIDGSDRLTDLACKLQPAGATLAIVSILLPPGRSAGIAALGWLAVCGLMAGSGVMRLGRALWSDGGAHITRIVVGIACIDLFIGGTWLVAARWGMRPMGIQEPIGLLTAVHFHFAGFATALIAAATLQFAERHAQFQWLKYVVLMVAVLPVVVAAGFVISPRMKLAAAVLFSANVAILAIALRACGTKAEDATAQAFLQVAAGAVFAGMMLSAGYAVADYLGSDALTIPQMARTHGILNGVGFSLSGLLGWLVESSESDAIRR